MPPSAPTGRPRTWESAWHDALYGPAGFYRRAAPAAHFATSVQGIPGAGELLAEAVVASARRHGCARVVDVGCGRGELLRHVRRLAPQLHLTGVDVVERPAGLGVDDWLVSPGGTGLPPDLTGLERTLVLAHEWLDVVPCPVVARDDAGVWRHVTVAGTATGPETLGPALDGAELAWAGRWLPDHVQRAEVGLPRDRAAADLLSRITSGLLVVVDYGHTRQTRPAHGTLTGFRDGREVDPVPDGSCDLTAHVALDSLVADLGAPAAPPRVRRQSERLADLLGDPQTPVPHGLATSDPAAYLARLARRAALTTLTAPGGLGDFWWVECVVGEDA